MRITVISPPSNTLYYVLKDHLRSASVLTNNSGAIITNADVRYYPYGEARFSTTPMLTDKLFTGQREITGLGIYHYGARFYSPKLGRFLSADTMTSNPDNPQKFNHYSYVGNNPLRYTDPTGHRACDDVDAAGRCITAPGGGGGGFGGSQPKKPRRGGGGGGPSIPAPVPGSCEAGNYSPRCPGWHFYTTTNLVCPAELHCAPEEMLDQFHRYVYPGQIPTTLAVDDRTYNVLACYKSTNWCLPSGPFGTIVVDISEDGFTTTNTTKPTHILHDGKVVRHLYQGEDGAWYVSSYGFGNNYAIDPTSIVHPGMGPLDSPILIDIASINENLGPDLFNSADQQMLMNILAHH